MTHAPRLACWQAVLMSVSLFWGAHYIIEVAVRRTEAPPLAEHKRALDEQKRALDEQKRAEAAGQKPAPAASVPKPAVEFPEPWVPMMDRPWAQIWAYVNAAQVAVWAWVMLWCLRPLRATWKSASPAGRVGLWPFLAMVFVGFFAYYLYHLRWQPDKYPQNLVIQWVKYPVALLWCAVALVPAGLLHLVRDRAAALSSPTLGKVRELGALAREAVWCLAVLIVMGTLSVAALLKAQRQPGGPDGATPEFYQYVLLYGGYYTALLGIVYFPTAEAVNAVARRLLDRLAPVEHPGEGRGLVPDADDERIIESLGLQLKQRAALAETLEFRDDATRRAVLIALTPVFSSVVAIGLDKLSF